MNLTGAVAKVATILNRNDQPANILDSINVAIRKVERKYDFNYMLSRNALAGEGVILPSGGYAVAYPPRLKKYITVTAFNGTDRLGDLKFITEAAAWSAYSATDKGEPKYATLLPDSSALLIRPSADKAYNLFSIHFLYSAPLVFVSNEIHWLLTNFEEVIIYGALMEMVPIVRDFDRETLWRGRFNEACKLLKNTEVSSLIDPESPFVAGAYSA